MQINQPVVFKPANFIQKGGKTNVLECATFIMKKQPLILEKRCSFLLNDIGIFIDFLVLEKKKTKMCSVDSCRSSILKKDEEKNLIVPFIKLKSAKKDKILLECVVSTSTAKHILKGVIVTKGKLKSDVNTISDLIRVENYVVNYIQIFSSLMRSDMKNINRKVLSRFGLGRMFETLRQEKKFKIVLFGFSENNCHDY